VGAGAAKPGPAIGQALGPLGLNMADFCKQFNEKTKDYEKDTPLPVELSAFSNRTFNFVVKTPPTSWFLKRCAGIEDGSKRPGHDIVGKVHVKQIYEIAIAKQADAHLKAIPLESLCKSIVGSCQSMGIEVVSDTVQGTFVPGNSISSSSSSSTAVKAPTDAKKPAVSAGGGAGGTAAKSGAGDKKSAASSASGSVVGKSAAGGEKKPAAAAATPKSLAGKK